MSNDVIASLSRLLRRYVDDCQQVSGSLPSQIYDPEWLSDCQIGEPDPNGMIFWRPLARDSVADFAGLERALEIEIHPDIKKFYASHWGSPIDVQAAEGGLTLIQIWNDDDFDRLVENILGHAMAKQRIKAPLTIFFACTDEDEHMLSVENDSGRVVLEAPGSLPIREISPTLAAFLDRLDPLSRPA